jgi:hypothetical protein
LYWMQNKTLFCHQAISKIYYNTKGKL